MHGIASISITFQNRKVQSVYDADLYLLKLSVFIGGAMTELYQLRQSKSIPGAYLAKT